MVIDRTLQTPNYRWHLAHNIRQTISNMPEQEKTRCLENIQARANLLGLPHDPQVLQYVTTLLNNKEPRNGISRRKSQ